MRSKLVIRLIISLCVLAFCVGLGIDALKIHPHKHSTVCRDIDVEPDADPHHCKHHRVLTFFL